MGRAITDRQSVRTSETTYQSAGMVAKGKKTKNPPILSHEFVIQNHADIVACVAMVFVVGLMFQISSPLASVFIALHHNVSAPVEIQPGLFLLYSRGEGYLRRVLLPADLYCYARHHPGVL